MKSAEIRQKFLKFFEAKDHTVVASSSLVPANDPTLLFTNAGMVQFKDVFLGLEKRPYSRAVSSQRCVRAGGKHNDLENVGYTLRHHTFFEMLGNFSFGDYFKREAIHFAWEFLTDVLAIPAEKLWITVFEEDEDAADIWLNDIKVDSARFSRLGTKDNFWQMGETGPCGPCSEIFYDHGSDIAGGPPGSPDEDGDRYVEIWNLVFMQYNRASDTSLTPLPKPSVDTGMGLERIAAVVQGVHDNYDIDMFQQLIAAIAEIAHCEDKQNKSLRVVADHIRSSSFLIADGVLPSNEGRGYVLRRIIRRAVRHGYKLGISTTFFYKLVAPLVNEMGAAYPELATAQSTIEKTLQLEEQQFAKTLEHGMELLETVIAALPDKQIPGETVFKLYDTFGFPLDLTADIARERDLTIDMPGFEKAMSAQRKRSQQASHFQMDTASLAPIETQTTFVGYECTEASSQITDIICEGKHCDSVNAGQQAIIVLEQTPFYAESGGQVGDSGVLQAAAVLFNVVDTQKHGAAVLHMGTVEKGSMHLGDTVRAEVNATERTATMLNHSATHLLHAALRKLLGEQVTQKGSLVDAEHLRFDFSQPESLSAKQIRDIENSVNQKIRENLAVTTEVMALDNAKKKGAMALFSEKYSDDVRVLCMGDFSVELCGGTHVKYTGQIGAFKIVNQESVAAGVRRIDAVTGQAAWDVIHTLENQQAALSALLKTDPKSLVEKTQQLLEDKRVADKAMQQLKASMANSLGSDLVNQATDIQGVKVLSAYVENIDNNALRKLLDKLKQSLKTAAIVLATSEDTKVNVVAGVTKNLIAKINAKDLVNHVAEQVGGRGGGRPDMAQAGGNNPKALPKALESVNKWIEERLT